MARIQFLNTYIDNLTMDEAVKAADSLIQENRNHYIVTPNLDHIVILDEDEEFREIYQNASLILTDGKPLIWISKLMGTPIKEKVSGSDFFPRICALAADKGYSMYILGAAEGVADKAAQNLYSKYHGIKIVGTYSPEYGFEKSVDHVEQTLRLIKKAKPDILAVALGSPKGEKFLYRYKDELCIPLSMSIGATIDFEAGNVKRAPKWMSNHGLEWLFRISRDPKRLIKRYLIDANKIIPIIRKYG